MFGPRWCLVSLEVRTHKAIKPSAPLPFRRKLERPTWGGMGDPGSHGQVGNARA